jgi:hypothetical protein
LTNKNHLLIQKKQIRRNTGLYRQKTGKEPIGRALPGNTSNLTEKTEEYCLLSRIAKEAGLSLWVESQTNLAYFLF